MIAGGGGMVVVESLDSAKRRGATILAEIVGYGASSDGADMVAPSGVGAINCIKQAQQAGLNSVDYINTPWYQHPDWGYHRAEAIRRVFGSELPPISSTKSMTGHSWAQWACKLIYCLLMLNQGFVAQYQYRKFG